MEIFWRLEVFEAKGIQLSLFNHLSWYETAFHNSNAPFIYSNSFDIKFRINCKRGMILVSKRATQFIMKESESTSLVVYPYTTFSQTQDTNTIFPTTTSKQNSQSRSGRLYCWRPQSGFRSGPRTAGWSGCPSYRPGHTPRRWKYRRWRLWCQTVSLPEGPGYDSEWHKEESRFGL